MVWESFGQTIATELSSFGQDVIALDNNATTIDFLADQVTKAAVGDITDIEFLRSAGIDTCDYSHYCNWRTPRIVCASALAVQKNLVLRILLPKL